MKHCFIIALLAVVVTSCNYSSFPIDDGRAAKADTNLLGIWKAAEDTNSRNFILIQGYSDLYPSVADIRRSYGNITNYVAYLNERQDKFVKDLPEELRKGYRPYDSATAMSELHENLKNSASEKNYYYITYFNQGGQNPRYWAFGAFPSEINGVRFLNVNYWHQPGESPKIRDEGYLLVKLLQMAPKRDTIITALVSDPKLKTAKSSAEVRSRLIQNLDNKNYYSDTVHFYKVSGNHSGFDEAMKLANQ